MPRSLRQNERLHRSRRLSPMADRQCPLMRAERYGEVWDGGGPRRVRKRNRPGIRAFRAYSRH
jgi:hypothetical protein